MLKKWDGTTYTDFTFLKKWTGQTWDDMELHRWDGQSLQKMFPAITPLPAQDTIDLYKAGEEYTQYTGGWVSDFAFYPQGNLAGAEKKSTGLYLKKQPSILAAPGWRTKNKMEFTHYKYVNVEYTIINSQYFSASNSFFSIACKTGAPFSQGADYSISGIEEGINIKKETFAAITKKNGYLCFAPYAYSENNILELEITRIYLSQI